MQSETVSKLGRASARKVLSGRTFTFCDIMSLASSEAALNASAAERDVFVESFVFEAHNILSERLQHVMPLLDELASAHVVSEALAPLRSPF